LPVDGDGDRVFEQIGLRVSDVSAISERLPLLGDVLAIDVPQNESTRHLDGAHRADATMRLLGEVIGALAPRPVVLVLEDSQWLDSASWRLIEWVLGSLSSLMLVLCVRAEETPEQFRSLQQRAKSAWTDAEPDVAARYLRILELAELGDASIHELVARTLGGAPPRHEITSYVAALAGGNPFFAEEISLTLKSEGLIAERDGFWCSIRPLHGLHYFEGVERTIGERVDRLDPKAVNVIRAAAVIGRTFGKGALVALEGALVVSKDSIDEALDALVAAHLVHTLPETGQYEFRHDQIRDVVYNSIPGDVRARLHGTLADWIEATHPDGVGAEAAMLVQHFEAAGNNDKAVKYANLAATDALKIGAFGEVEAFVGICIAHEPKRQLWSDEQKLQSVRWRRWQTGAAQLGDHLGKTCAARSNSRCTAGRSIAARAGGWRLVGKLGRGACALFEPGGDGRLFRTAVLPGHVQFTWCGYPCGTNRLVRRSGGGLGAARMRSGHAWLAARQQTFHWTSRKGRTRHRRSGDPFARLQSGCAMAAWPLRLENGR
jgi:hypothetical protein